MRHVTWINHRKISRMVLHCSMHPSWSSGGRPDRHGNYTTVMHRRLAFSFGERGRSKRTPSWESKLRMVAIYLEKSGESRKRDREGLWESRRSTFRSGIRGREHRLQIRHSDVQSQNRIGTLLRNQTHGIFQSDDALPERRFHRQRNTLQ
jgi:hypothetical protein